MDKFINKHNNFKTNKMIFHDVKLDFGPQYECWRSVPKELGHQHPLCCARPVKIDIAKLNM